MVVDFVVDKMLLDSVVPWMDSIGPRIGGVHGVARLARRRSHVSKPSRIGLSHRVLERPGWPGVVFAFHDSDELGPHRLADRSHA